MQYASFAAIAGNVEPACELHRAEARDAGRRLLGHAGESGRDVGTVLDDPGGQLGAVVDHDLGPRVCDGEQVCVELVARRAVPCVHLDPTGDERRADRVLRRARVRAGGDDMRAGVREQGGQVGRLRLQVDDDGDPPPAERPVRQPLASEPVQNGRVFGDPADPLLARRGERRIGDLGAGRGVHVRNLSGGCEYPRAHPGRASRGGEAQKD